MTHPAKTPTSRSSRAALLAALTLPALASCSDDAPSPSAVAATSPEASSASPPAEVGPEEGSWATAPLDQAAFRRTLERADLTEHASAFAAGITDETVLTLELEDGYWTQYSAMGGGAVGVNDRGTYEVDGHTFVVTPMSGGQNVYRWRIDDDQLTLRFVSTTEPPFEGRPGEVYQRAFYTAAPFTRVP